MSRDSIKMVAMLTMLINHIANVFLPAGQPLTNLCLCIGYFTAVTMCFFLVEGYGCTRSKRRYAGRLLGFAVLAALCAVVLKNMVVENMPVIGGFLAEVINAIEARM